MHEKGCGSVQMYVELMKNFIIINNVSAYTNNLFFYIDHQHKSL
jgi:hypothetical protein